MPVVPSKPSGKGGKIAKSNARNLLERLQKHETTVLLFANHFHVAFTNNRAERDLKNGKSKRKGIRIFSNKIIRKSLFSDIELSSDDD